MQLKIPDKCQRNQCGEVPRFVINFDRYTQGPNTYACKEHAGWWTRGPYNISLGTATPLERNHTWK